LLGARFAHLLLAGHVNDYFSFSGQYLHQKAGLRVTVNNVGSVLLQGVLFHDRMAPEVLEKVRPALIQLEESYLTAHPGVAIQRVT
jgi:hypothetical protein